MIITPIRYFFLVLLISVSTYAKTVDITFEVFSATNDYLDIAQDKALKLQDNGFECYIVKGRTNLSLRCDDSKSSAQMQENINRLNKNGVVYTIINKSKKVKRRKKRTLNEFYFGYAAFDRKDYKKALNIFKYHYSKENTYEHAYAYALALMKTGQYESALKVLKAYKSDTKAKKLANDIASTSMYEALRRNNYAKAHAIVDKHIYKSKKLHKVINEQEVSDAIKSKEHEKAATLAKQYGLTHKTFEIDYARALSLVKLKKYAEANVILVAYMKQEKIAKNLFISNTLSIASTFYAQKDYEKALQTLENYRKNSVKIQTLYDDIVYNRALQNGWNLVDKNPKKALSFFKEACGVKKEYGCYSGMTYSYFNLQTYDKSLYLAQKLYANKQSDELSIIAMRSALKMNNYDEAKRWFEATKNKKGLMSPYFLETFLMIDEYIKSKDYIQAQNIVSYLKNLYPTNIEVLKREAQLLIAQKKYDEAQEVAEQILALDPTSLEAKYTLALYEFEHQDYSSCSFRLASLTLTQPYQVQLSNRCGAYERLEEKDVNGAISHIEKIKDNGIKAAFYVDMGNIYKLRGDNEAIRAYKEAKKYRNYDIDIEFIYLYALKDFTKDDELDKELMKAYSKYPKSERLLDAFKKDYQKDRLYGYYKNKRYGECYNYSNVIEEDLQDKDVYKMGGWCAYSLEKYGSAKEKFAKINDSFGESAENIYPYALSCYQNGEYERAISALNRIQVVDSEKETLLIAGLYMDLKEQDIARTLLLKLSESPQRDVALLKINKSYTQSSYENSASMGMHYQAQTGIEGKNKFDKFVVPLDYDYYEEDDEYHLYFDGDLLYLYNGYLANGEGSFLDFGLATNTQDDALGSDIGFMPKVGVDYKNFRVQLGTTPLGAKITPEPTWLVSGYFKYDAWKFSLKHEQKEIDETMLSFVGERATDGNLEVNWGRMLKRGFEAEASYDSSVNLSLSLGYYPEIFGLNVENNSESKATFVAIYHPKVDSISYLDFGALVAFDAYEKNSNSFTYGHGGYFSPQQFWLGSIFTKFGDIVSEKFFYQAKISMGFEGFIIDDSLKFPLNDGIINSGELQKGYRDGGVTYKGAIQLGYKLIKGLDFISGVSLEKMNGYSVGQFSFALVYRFDAKGDETFNSFGLNHRVDDIIK